MRASRAGLVGAALLLGGGLLVPVLHGSAAEPEEAARPAVLTELPGLVPAAGDPLPEGLRTVRPRPGTTARVPGPFDDRFTLAGTRYADGAATGSLTVTSDVSDLLDLQVVVGFYDGQGALLGTGTWEQHGEGAGHELVYRVPAPPGVRDRVAATAVAVPVLVNE